MRTESETKAYDEGFLAYYEYDKMLKDNPYREGTGEFSAWVDGYGDAKANDEAIEEELRESE